MRRDYRFLRQTAVAFIAAVAIHGADHMLRGIQHQSAQVIWVGTIQAVLGVLTVRMVFQGQRGAPTAAMLIGFASAVLFSTAHLLPAWGSFSDSYLTPAAGSGISWFSWITAVLEISADLVFGWAGLSALVHERDLRLSDRAIPTGARAGRSA